MFSGDVSTAVNGACARLCKNHYDRRGQPPTPWVWGTTASAYPTFWFFVPGPVQEDTEVRFVLQKQEMAVRDQYVYNKRFVLNDSQSGIVRISLPNTQEPLQVGQRYLWTFSAICDAHRNSRNNFVQGTIQRLSLPHKEHQTRILLPIDLRFMGVRVFGLMA